MCEPECSAIGPVSPGPGWGWLIQDEEGGVVVAMEEMEVLHIAHSLTEVPQRYGVAGLDVMVLTGRERER